MGEHKLFLCFQVIEANMQLFYMILNFIQFSSKEDISVDKSQFFGTTSLISLMNAVFAQITVCSTYLALKVILISHTVHISRNYRHSCRAQKISKNRIVFE
jgi:hypothetical protein